MIGSDADQQQQAQNGRHLATCFGCSRPIKDEYSLHVSDDDARQWHSQCLRCQECGKRLEDERTCFLQDNGLLYCRHDLFRCPGCSSSFELNDLVVQVRPRTVYHSACFRCISCHRPLASSSSPNSSSVRRSHPRRHPTTSLTDFALLPDGPLCRDDFLAAVEGRLLLREERPKKESSPRGRGEVGRHGDDRALQGNGRRVCNSSPTSDELSEDEPSFSDECKSLTELSDGQLYTASIHPLHRQGSSAPLVSARGPGVLGGSVEGGEPGRRGPVVTASVARVRTVMNEAQLGVLRAFYGRNSRPDSATKDRLAEITGLPTKVIRVWFQNKRCKDKKKIKTRTSRTFI